MSHDQSAIAPETTDAAWEASHRPYQHMIPYRIQIVDRDPVVALVTQLGLQARLKTEANVILASGNPLETSLPGPVDLLIVDPGVQIQGATRLVKCLQARYPYAHVLILTAYDSPRLRSQMKFLGVRHYLAKPVDVADLEHAVRSCMPGT